MARDYISPVLPLTGAEYVMVTQLDPASGQYHPRRVRISDILATGAAAQAACDAAQDAALAQEAGARQAANATEAGARGADDATTIGRLSAIESRPEEIAHFTASAKFLAVAAAASFTLTLTGLSPIRAGDVLKAGEQVEIWPAGAVPTGVTFGRPTVTADGVVALPCTAGLAVAASSAAVPFSLAALR